MPANLTPDYLAAEERYKKAASPEEKLEALEAMLSTIPKHKGTEKLQADIKSKLAKQRKQMETKGAGGPARHKEMYTISREGAGRIVLVGAPNTGKSRLFVALTAAPSEVADYPFTTRKPCPGMMPFEDITIQLIDAPAVSTQYMESWVPQIIRHADVALLVVDVSSMDPVRQIREPVAILEERKVRLVPCTESRVGDESGVSIAQIPTILAVSFMDVDGAREMLELLASEAAPPFDVAAVSAASGEGLDGLRRLIFDGLRIDRVFSKQPGKKPSPAPFVLAKGSTVIDFAEKVHRDFVERFEFARVWRRGDEKEGIRVSKDFVLVDGDTVELHV